MCIFSRQVEVVAATKIFARGLPDGRQALIYAMDVAAKEPLAMVLPLPVPPNGGEDAVEFVNLEGYTNLFDDLNAAFPTTGTVPAAQSLGRGPIVRTLVVHQVGAFVASYVPAVRDFDRLDPRFRLPSSVLSALPQYADWGFAVFQLDKSKRTSIHPMAMRFPRRDPAAVFFPTVHVHDGKVPETANFDHQFYAQLDPLVARIAGWTPSHGPLGKHVDARRSRDLVDAPQPGHTTVMLGPAPNRDLVLGAPPVTAADLDGGGDSYRYSINARFHYALEGHPMYPRWRETSATRLPRLCAGVRAGLAELTSRNASAWQLGSLHDQLPPYFMNGPKLWWGTDYRHGGPRGTEVGPGKIAFTPFGQLVEIQNITLGFTEVPSEDDAQAINRALCELLDRVVS